jgi:hypothetical protein
VDCARAPGYEAGVGYCTGLLQTCVPKSYWVEQETDRRKEICIKALELFTQRGFDNPPLSLIARRLGLSKAGLIYEVGRLSDDHYDIITNVWKRAFALLRNSLRELEISGKVKEMHHSFGAFALIGMCTWTSYWFDYSRKDSIEKIIESYIEIFSEGSLVP